MSGYDDDREERDVSTEPDVGIDDRGRKLPGVAALGLFAVMAWVFVGAEFGEAAAGFGSDGESITASIGYAMFNIPAENAIPSEGFLIPFEIIDLVLVAALVGAVMLARRDDAGEITSALRSDAVEQEGSPQETVGESSRDEVVADGGRDGGEE
ncbi:NADH-quinone oxidoreductase subunit J family protein [Halorussus salinisoli]|uniref:NADH-quinone oxidoreductase subunit J family protein n=1 Tax=Halorussus salinisoli TaxID=2558242 RepID=UPI002A920E37|nr:NADH-quinone oxidoreductase subunit J [Halorussus salinisoli]